MIDLSLTLEFKLREGLKACIDKKIKIWKSLVSKMKFVNELFFSTVDSNAYSYSKAADLLMERHKNWVRHDSCYDESDSTEEEEIEEGLSSEDDNGYT